MQNQICSACSGDLNLKFTIKLTNNLFTPVCVYNTTVVHIQSTKGVHSFANF